MKGKVVSLVVSLSNYQFSCHAIVRQVRGMITTSERKKKNLVRIMEQSEREEITIIALQGAILYGGLRPKS